MPPLPPPGPGDDAVVSVVVPARNEERSLPTLLASLRPSGAEVVVVDDASEDATAEVARTAGARVVGAPPLPAGWTGKTWACHTGTRVATGPLLVFLDADTRLEAGGLGRLVAAHARYGGLVTVQPFHETVRLYERLSAFPNLVGAMAVDAFTPLGRRRGPTGAFGPCLVIDRNAYDRIGGHAAVRGEVVEDLALAQRCRAAGVPVTCFGGRGTVAYRMYPDGVRDLVRGWTKNLGSASLAVRRSTALLVAVWLSGVASAPLASVDPRPGLVLYAAYGVQLAVLFGRIGRFGSGTAILFPLAFAGFVWLFGRSLLAHLLGRPSSWRGRDVGGRPG